MRQQLLEQNPNMLFIAGALRVHNHLLKLLDIVAFPEGSDLYLRDSNGEIIRNDDSWRVPYEYFKPRFTRSS